MNASLLINRASKPLAILHTVPENGPCAVQYDFRIPYDQPITKQANMRLTEGQSVCVGSPRQITEH